MRADVTEIAAYLRKVADLYFAIYEVSCDRSAEAHGFAYAKAADNIAATSQGIMDVHMLRFEMTTSNMKFANLVPSVGKSISAVVSDFVRHGDSMKVKSMEDRLHIKLLPELQEIAQLEGMSEPFVFGLAHRFGFVDKASLLEKLSDIRKYNDRIYMRVYRALLIDAQKEVKQVCTQQDTYFENLVSKELK